MSIKNRYRLNKSNHLIIKHKSKGLLTDGRFSLDKDNQLTYWLNEPESWRRLYNLPPKISFEGNWKLNSNYDLELILDKIKDQFRGDHLVLKGEIISIDKDTLVFGIKSIDKQGQSHIQLLKLGGFWQADEFNQLSFIVKKKALPDTLTLEGGWQINKNQQIIYTYEKTDLKTKTKYLRTLTFEGFWQINIKNKLTYILSKSLESHFDFRIQLESPNLYPQEGVIKYRLGVGLRDDKTYQTKIISLYGTWKFSRKMGLSFIMDYGQGKTQAIKFGTDIYLTKKDEISFSLNNKKGKPLGVYITFTHRFLKRYAAEMFLRLKSMGKERGIDTGLRIPF